MKKIETDKTIKVCIADDHHFVRGGMVNLVQTFPRVKEVYAVANGQQLLDTIPFKKPDIILLDVQMPVMNGIEASEIILKRFPEVKILILTLGEDNEVMVKLLQMGVHGYITKSEDVDVVEQAIYQVIDKGYFHSNEVSLALLEQIQSTIPSRFKATQDKGGVRLLTEREIEIVKLICQELDNETIANQLNISVKTLLVHKQHIYTKTGAKSLISLYQFALRAAIIKS